MVVWRSEKQPSQQVDSKRSSEEPRQAASLLTFRRSWVGEPSARETRKEATGERFCRVKKKVRERMERGGDWA